MLQRVKFWRLVFCALSSVMRPLELIHLHPWPPSRTWNKHWPPKSSRYTCTDCQLDKLSLDGTAGFRHSTRLFSPCRVTLMTSLVPRLQKYAGWRWWAELPPGEPVLESAAYAAALNVSALICGLLPPSEGRRSGVPRTSLPVSVDEPSQH